MKKIKEQQWYLIILSAVVFVVFLGSLILITGNGLYLSPDETANAFFAERFATSGTLSFPEPLNRIYDNSLHPRSILSIDAKYLPQSFVGLPFFYGVVAAAFGDWVIAVLTPIVSLLAIFAFYLIVKKQFSIKVAFYSALLFATLPAWWYFSARSLMHNVLFVSLLIFATYFLVNKPIKKILPGINIALGGLFFGFAFFVRTSEVIWVMLALLLAYLISRVKIDPKKIVIFCLSILIGVFPMFFLNRATYGGPLTFGYSVQKVEVDSVMVPTDVDPLTVAEPVQSNFREAIDEFVSPALPFGIHPRAMWRNFSSYAIMIFWWLSIFFVVGLAVYAKQKIKPKEKQLRKIYLSVFAFVALWLIAMYGSWTIFDNPDPSAITIGNSHVRYWLPIYILGIPIIALALEWIEERLASVSSKRLFILTIFILFFGLSFRTVFFSSNDALVPAARTLLRSNEIQYELLSIVDSESIVIVDRADKLLFPDRIVLQPLRSEKTFALMPRLALRGPLYYYGVTFPKDDIDYLNEMRLKELGLRISLVKTFDAESLYWIERLAL